MAAHTDAALEQMTQSLLQVSLVFHVQQNELQAVRERLAKELSRVDAIQEALTTAAQQHQDAVLTVIQNYENLAVAHDSASAASVNRSDRHSSADADMLGELSNLDQRMSRVSVDSSAASEASPSPRSSRRGGMGAAQQSARALQLPRVATSLQVFRPAPKPPSPGGADSDSEEEGIQYIENMCVTGGVLGTKLYCNGDFVGQPSIQWSRLQQRKGSPQYVEIPGATSLEYFPTADDVGTSLRVEAQGPYGGDKVVVQTDTIAVDPSTHAALDARMRKGQAEFNCTSAQVSSPPPRPRDEQADPAHIPQGCSAARNGALACY